MEILYYYSKGKLHGNQKKWYSNGIQRGEWNYQNDILDGISKEWNFDGKIKSIYFHQNIAFICKGKSASYFYSDKNKLSFFDKIKKLISYFF